MAAMDGNINLNITLNPSEEAPAWATELKSLMVSLVNSMNTEKDLSMALSANVQVLVDQVAASTSFEASSAAAMRELVNQSAALKKTVDEMTAAGTGMSVEDAAAISKAATDLAASAVALAAAVPAAVPPPAVPVAEIPPATPDVMPPVVASPDVTPPAATPDAPPV